MKEMDSNQRYKVLKDILGVKKTEVEKGLEIHKKSIVCDSLCPDPKITSEKTAHEVNEMLKAGMPLSVMRQKIENTKRDEFFNDPLVYEEYKDVWDTSGVTCISYTVPSTDLQSTVSEISYMNFKYERMKDILCKATCVNDIIEAKKMKKHAIMLNFQNTMVIEPKGIGLDAIDLFYGLGIRVIQLTYNLRNYAGDGCTEKYGSGLSYFGTDIVEKMNKNHMLVDLSHCGYQTTLDAIDVSKDPVAFTHTGCQEIYDHPRAKKDEQIKALAEKGGYMGIFTLPFFLAPNYAGRLAKPGEKGTLNELLNHIDHAVKIAGVDHIGIGSDTTYRGRIPDEYLKLSDEEQFKRGFTPQRFWSGWAIGQANRMLDPIPDDWANSWINWPNISIGLVSRGYSDKEIEKIIGGNWIRILKEVVG